LHTPETTTTSTIPQFFNLLLAPAFLTYAGFAFLSIGVLIFYFAPRYGQRLPIVYIGICSLIGSLVVIATQGLGSAIVHSAENPDDNQLMLWQTWIVIAFVVIGISFLSN
jgi:hypothetical protein